MTFLANLCFVVFFLVAILLVFSLWIKLEQEQGKRNEEMKYLLTKLKETLEREAHG